MFQRHSLPTQATKHFKVYNPVTPTTIPTLEPTLHTPINPALLAPDSRPTTPPTKPTQHDGINNLKAQLEAAQTQADMEEAIAAAIIPPAPLRQTNPYLEHTKFQLCLGGLDWAEIREYIIPTTTPALNYLKKSVQSTTLVYQYITASTPRWARIQVMQEHLQHVPMAPLIPYLAFNNKHSNTLVYIFTFFYQVLSQRLPSPTTLSLTKRQAVA